MSTQVKVEDLQVFSLFRAALLKFAQAADRALSSADSQIVQTHMWLEGEQPTYWQSQQRKRYEAVQKARDAVRQKTLYKDAGGHVSSAVEEHKALAKCVAALEQAEEKLKSLRKALPRLQKASDLYRGGVSRLSVTVTTEIPKAVALLDRLAMSLDEYLQIEAPQAEAPTAAEPTVVTESMARGGTAETPAPPVAGGEVPPAEPNQPAAKQEGGDGHH